MAFVIADRVRESTTTTGTGTITLAGAVNGFQSFSAGIGNGNSTYYTISNNVTNQWEVGIGTYTSAGSTLSRTTVLASSNAGSLVNFSTGTADVFVTYPSERAVYVNSANTSVTVPALIASTSITNSGLTSGRVVYSTTGGLETDSANLTFDGTTLTTAGLSDSGNLTFTGTGNRITGDFSNATVANRVYVQTSATNSNTNFGALPSGTATTASLSAWNNSDPTNAAFFVVQANGSTDVRLNSGITGTGTYLPMTFYTSGTERMRISPTGTGLVSVGRTGGFTGSETFTANGFGSFGSDSAPQVLIGNTGSGAGVLGTFNNYGMEFRTNNTERMRIDSSGNVGIGVTSTGGYKFAVGGSGLKNQYITTDANNAYLYTDGSSYIGTTGAFNNVFITNNTERMRIDSSGNVGIGTSSPGAKLDVVGNINASSTTTLPAVLALSNQAAGFAPANIQMRRVGAGNTTTPDSQTLGQIRFDGLSTGAVYDNAAFIQVDSGVNASGGMPSFMTFGTATSGAGATERMRIDSSGNVGIGTNSPAVILDVGPASGTTTNTVMRINGGGTAGYGPQLRFSSAGTLNSTLGTDQAIFGGSSADFSVYATTGNGVRFYTNGANERMRIDSSGNLLVGTTSSSFTSGTGIKLRPAQDGSVSVTDTYSTNAATSYIMYSTGAGTYRFYVDWGGTIHATSIVITAISDERLKENVRDIDTGLNSIMALKPRRFDWKEGKGQDKKNAAGFIAQEFETVFPECVSTSKAGEDGIEYKNINHETLIPTLVKAIQELKAINDTQAETINALTARIVALETK